MRKRRQKTTSALGVSFREQMETRQLTKEKYDRDQVLPDRIKYTDIGKQAVSDFVHATDARNKVEWPEQHEEYMATPAARYAHLVFMFCKYMVEADIKSEDNAAHLHIVRTPEGRWHIINNFINPGAVKSMEYMLDGCKELISEKAKD